MHKRVDFVRNCFSDASDSGAKSEQRFLKSYINCIAVYLYLQFSQEVSAYE